MADKILFVDDEQAVLDGYARLLHREFDLEVALGAEEGLAAIGSSGPFAIVISDMRMPGMCGSEFLAEVCERSPDSIRMLLTGCTDLTTAIRALNEGRIFFFLTKPTERDGLIKAIRLGLAEHHKVVDERRRAQLAAVEEHVRRCADDCGLPSWDDHCF
jgi:DNA-binding NtrC family response regulator